MKTFLGKAQNVVGNHLFALCFALLVGILSGLPSLLAPRALGPMYQGIPFLYQSDEEIYLSRIEEVLDGHPSLGSPVLHEYKDKKTAWFPFGEYLYALPVLFGFSLFSVLLVSKFLFPLVLFLLIYALVLLLLKSGDESRLSLRQGVALATALLVTLGYDFVHVSHIVALLKDPQAFYLSPWTRLVNPVIGGLILFGALSVLFYFLERGGKKLWVLLAVLLLLSSSYFFSFALFLTILLYWTLVLFVLEKKQGQSLALAALVLLGGVVLGVQAFVGRIGTTPSEAEVALTKNGLLFTHLPLSNGVLIATTIIFILTTLYGVRKKIFTLYPITILSRWWWFLLGGLLSSFAVFSQQLLTGRTIWPHHFVQYTIPLCYITLLVLFGRLMLRVRTAYIVVLLTPLFLATLGFGVWAATTYKTHLPLYSELQSYQPLFNFLNNSKTSECTVMAVEMDDYLSTKIPAFTRCDVYYSIFVYYGVPQDRIEHSYFTLLRFRGITPEMLPAYFKEHDVEMRVATFTNWQQLFRHVADPWMRKVSDDKVVDAWIEETRVRLTKDYTAFVKADFKQELTRYQVTYVVWDRERYGGWSAASFPFLTPVYSDSRVVVYQIK